MIRIRSRVASAAAVAAIAASTAVASSLVAVPVAPAADAAALMPSQTLFLTERFTESGPARGALGGQQPEAMVALRGEREGFQVAFKNTTGAPGALRARIVPTDAALGAAQATGAIGFELLRVGFVNVPVPSKGIGTKAGRYADPLPPFTDEAGGALNVAAGAWGGAAVIAKVRTDATPGGYTANLELYSGDTVYARQAFSLDVRNATLLQPGSPKSFKTVMNVEAEAYWLQDNAMRRGPSEGFPTYADRMAQVAGLFKFLDQRNITPLEMPFGNPSGSGRYDCSYGDTGVARRTFLSQLTERYFNRPRDLDPGAQQFPSRFLSSHSPGCDIKSTSDDFEGTFDKYRTPGVKQDDVLNPRAAGVFRAIASAWRSNGLYTSSTYVKNPFDEPGGVDARQRATQGGEVPKANQALHAAVGRSAKVVLAAWPRDARDKRVCRRVAGGSQRCTTLSGDKEVGAPTFDNRRMWDGRGTDDVDVWMPHFSRAFGRTTPSIVARNYGVNRERLYADRLKGIRAKAGRETWVYNFYTASKVMPQVTIDAPGTDPRLQYLMLARDGHTGLFISNLMLGWGGEVKLQPGTNARRKGNPYDQATYFSHSIYGLAAGWGTFIYPGYRPELGLTGETARNSENAVPVTSLRMEAMRDGGEDANLIAMYRERFGDAKLQKTMKSIFPGTSVAYPKTLGQVVGPRYDNGRNLAQRMESLRRRMITELTA